MTRVISISDDVYDGLVRLKGRKSFSEVIRELSKAKPNILDFFGVFKR